MENIILSPPVVFLFLLIGLGFFYGLSSRLAFKPGKIPAGLKKSYTCGEEVTTNRVQPDYSQFFPFAFFFTILHVVTLMIATAMIGTIGAFAIAVIYIMGVILGLTIIFRD